jgi:hypothetical protein
MVSSWTRRGATLPDDWRIPGAAASQEKDSEKLRALIDRVNSGDWARAEACTRRNRGTHQASRTGTWKRKVWTLPSRRIGKLVYLRFQLLQPFHLGVQCFGKFL